MWRFPQEFADLLSARGRRLLVRGNSRTRAAFDKGTPIVLLPDVIAPALAPKCMRLLDDTMLRCLRPMRSPIPRDAIRRMKRNYSEMLGKTMCVSTATLGSGRSRASVMARQSGLLAMLRSDTFHRFAEIVNGYELERHVDCQIIAYRHGDYAGPHNDHHPEIEEVRDGYVDVHIMFSNSAVSSQLLIYEESGYLAKVADVSSPAAVVVYRLPFWHQVTPLIGKPGREAQARRWLLLGSFRFA